MAQTTLVCPECSFQKVVPHWEDGGNIAFCPNCTDVGRSKLQTLMSGEMFVQIEFQKQLKALIYCRDCGHIVRVGTLSYNGPSDDLNSETYCPNCYSGSGPINASLVNFCKRCGEREARTGLDFCSSCFLDNYVLAEEMQELADRWAEEDANARACRRSWEDLKA